MSVAALMLVKDEADILGYTLDHLATQVDHIYIADNLSTDGTEDVIQAFRERLMADGNVTGLTWTIDEEVGYWQARKTTDLARVALDDGHEWVLPCDADEWWHTNDLRPIREWVGGLAPNIGKVEALVYNHLATTSDPPAEREPDPTKRIGWRQRQFGMKKILVRNLPGIEIAMGNHDATVPTSLLRVGGVSVRHFSWRTREQYLRKIRNGEKAYAATTLDPGFGIDWRRWSEAPDEAILQHFDTWFMIHEPERRDDLIYDPAP